MSGYPATRHQKKIGRLYGVGVGPGDSELLTLRAYRVLSRVPVVFVPQKDSESQSFASSIIKSIVKDEEQRIVRLVFPMIKGKENLRTYWEQAIEQIWEYLKTGHDCAFVNIGDALFYGTFVHILETMQKTHPEVEIEVIPGISSVNAAAAQAIVPLASNDERIAIISAESDDGFIRETLKNFDTVVFLKINNMFDRLLAILEETKLVEKSVYVRRCTTRDEEIVRDISRLKGSKLDYFSLLLVRK